MVEETAQSSTTITGALASIADYGSGSDLDEVEHLPLTQSTTLPIPTADFEIKIDEDEVIDDDSLQVKVQSTNGDTLSRTKISNPFAIRHQIELEDVVSEDELPVFNMSDDDSDAEFDRILAYTAKQRKKEHDRDMGITPSKRGKTDITKNYEREYEKFPPIENLSISVNESVVLKKLGSVKSIVDCLVVIEADSGLAVDYDSVVFKSDRSALGKVFDIFGAVRSPSYSIRFNSDSEAREMAKEGMEVFLADSDQYTRNIFTDKLKNERHTDGVLVLNDKGEEEELYSDDEMEEAAKRNGGSRGRGKGGRGRGGRGERGGRGRGGIMNWPPNNRGRSGGYNFNSPYGGGGPPMIDTRYMGGS